MSIPTLTDPALSATNDASVVEQNDRNIAASMSGLLNTTNVAQFKGLRVYAATGVLKKGIAVLPGTYAQYLSNRTVEFFLFWNQHPNLSDDAYLDMSAYAVRADNQTGHQPDTVTVTLQRSASVAGTYSDVGSVILDSADAGGLSLLKKVDLSGVSYNTGRSFHRVKVEASAGSAVYNDATWANYPVFVAVNVRMKSSSAA